MSLSSHLQKISRQNDYKPSAHEEATFRESEGRSPAYAALRPPGRLQPEGPGSPPPFSAAARPAEPVAAPHLPGRPRRQRGPRCGSALTRKGWRRPGAGGGAPRPGAASRPAHGNACPPTGCTALWKGGNVIYYDLIFACTVMTLG